MSFAELTSPDTDVVNIELRQDDSAETRGYFKQPFLLPNKQYCIGVTELSCPMGNTKLLTTAAPELLYIKRRNVGQDRTSAPHTDIDGRGLQVGGVENGNRLDDLVDNANINSAPVAGSTIAIMDQVTVGTLNINRLPLTNINDVLVLLNSFSASFTNRIYRVGINEDLYGQSGNIAARAGNAPEDFRMFTFGINPSGFLCITMQPQFSNNFYFEISENGKQLLGLEQDIIAVTQNAGVITRTGSAGTLWDGATDLILAGQVTVAVQIISKTSLFQTLSTRVSVAVETDLPITSTIVCNQGKESSNYNLCSYALPTEINSTIFLSSLGLDGNYDVSTKIFNGQHVFQSRGEPPTQWSILLPVDTLQSVRCRLVLTYRYYNSITKVWELKKIPFPFTNNAGQYWSVGLRFVSLD